MKHIARIIAFTFLIVSCAAMAQQPSTPPKPPAAPVVSLELKEKIFKALAQLGQAQQAATQATENLQSKTKAWQDAVVELGKVCGDKFTAQLDQGSGDPICVAKPAEPAKAPEAP